MRGMIRHHQPGPSSGHHQQESRPDLFKLGQKFGGSISIGVIDSGNNRSSGKKSGPGDGTGVMIQKLKGDIPVGVPMNIRESPGPKQQGMKGSNAQAAVAQQNADDGTSGNAAAGGSMKSEPGTVKEEPKDFDGDEEGDNMTRGQNDEFEDFYEEDEFEGEEGEYQEEEQYGGVEGEVEGCAEEYEH